LAVISTRKLLVILAILLLIPSGLIINGFYQKHHQCVRLPNGVIIAFEAYMNFWRPYFLPDVIVRGPRGEILSRGNDETFYFSQTTAYWADFEPDPTDPSGESVTRLVYHPEHGLVSGPNYRVLRRQLIEGAGPLLEEGSRINNTNVLGVLLSLRDVEEYASYDCHMTLISFARP
jgi:hypothetical protein